MTVDVVVAHPAGRDARRVSTLELAGAAGGQGAVHLVRAVAAVVLAVAHKVLGDAAAAGARELVGGAGDVAWGGGQRSALARRRSESAFEKQMGIISQACDCI